ncbi:mycothione reductase [Hoyosella sp. G463]|uniref:Mycothione reductase n=1 Tax=Lolliginicoccus lacisalsi TaxID=2742202 RepID=A0A927PK06_9ACTN|nr:mycothione reductase [Lolliginicoccus lacisalsi]
MEHYDIVIIGAGSGNMIVNRKFASKKVAIIEANKFGGTCLNVGCIPTKMFVYTADVAAHIREAARFGITARLDSVDWPAIVDRIFSRIDANVAAAKQFREDNPNVTVYSTRARFIEDHVLELAPTDDEGAPGGTGAPSTGGQRISADQIVIATGSRPTIPDQFSSFDAVASGRVPVYTSDDIMRIPQLPDRLVIVGGGFIAAEFAHVFSELGVEVTLVERGPALLRHHDGEISQRFTALASKQWKVRLNTEVTAVEESPGGARVTLSTGDVLECAALLAATGRAPDTGELGLGNTSVRVEEDGRIVVDAHQRTSADGVWALGDVCSPWMLKHVANHEARVVQHNLLHPGELIKTDHRVVPSGVFTAPQIATVGLTSEMASEAGLDVVESVFDYKDVAYGWAMDDPEGFCKVIVDRPTGLIVGAHLLGAHATALIQQVVQAMTFGISAAEMARGQYWVHPALPEVVENALLGARIR